MELEALVARLGALALHHALVAAVGHERIVDLICPSENGVDAGLFLSRTRERVRIFLGLSFFVLGL